MPVVIYNLSHYLFRRDDRFGHKLATMLLYVIAAAIQVGTVASLVSLEAARVVGSGLLLLLPSTFEPHQAAAYSVYQERTYVTISNWCKAGCIWLMYLGAKRAIGLVREGADGPGIALLAGTFFVISLLGYLPIA